MGAADSPFLRPTNSLVEQGHTGELKMSVRLMIAVLLSASAAPALASDVGITLSLGQPGFYGRVEIGGYPQPQVIYRQPKMMERGHSNRAPIYLHVPPGYAKHWGKHCHEYNACGEPVYFVQDNWYNREYVPRYQRQHGPRNSHHDEQGNNHYQNNGRSEGKDHGRHDQQHGNRGQGSDH